MRPDLQANFLGRTGSWPANSAQTQNGALASAMQASQYPA